LVVDGIMESNKETTFTYLFVLNIPTTQDHPSNTLTSTASTTTTHQTHSLPPPQPQGASNLSSQRELWTKELQHVMSLGEQALVEAKESARVEAAKERAGHDAEWRRVRQEQVEGLLLLLA
jgi:hypothetical protein